MQKPLYYRGPWRWVVDSDMSYWAPPDGCVGSLDLRPLGELSQPGQTAGQLAGTGVFVTLAALPKEFDLLGEGALHDIKPGKKIRDAIPKRLGFSVEGDDLLSMLRSLFMLGSDPAGGDAVRPLIPGADGYIEFHCGPLCHHREKMSVLNPHWNRVRDVVRSDFQQVFDAAKAGRLKDAEQHRRVLDATCEKYGIEDWREVVPDRLKSQIEGRLKHETTYSDDFNRADSTGLGASWGTSIGSGCDIVSNQARGANATAGATRVRYESDLSSSDNYGQSDLVTLPATDATTGALCRYQSGADTAYAWTYRSTTNPRRRLIRFSAGAATIIGSDNTAPGASTLKVEANGSAIKAYVGGVEVTSVAATDTAITTGLRGGILALQNPTIGNRSVHDNFENGDLTAPPSIKYTQLEKGLRGYMRGVYVGAAN